MHYYEIHSFFLLLLYAIPDYNLLKYFIKRLMAIIAVRSLQFL